MRSCEKSIMLGLSHSAFTILHCVHELNVCTGLSGYHAAWFSSRTLERIDNAIGRQSRLF
jgi:hypothetical protein